MDVSELLSVSVAHDVVVRLQLGSPRRRETAGCHSGASLHSKAAGAIRGRDRRLRLNAPNDVLTSSGLSNRSPSEERICPRSDPAIIHPRSRGVCRRQAKKRASEAGRQHRVRLVVFAATAPATSRYSPQSAAPYRAIHDLRQRHHSHTV